MTIGSPGDTPTPEPLRDALAAADALGLIGPVAAGEAVRDETGRIVDFRMIAVNPAGAMALGLDAGEIVGATWSTLWPHMFEVGAFDAFVDIVESREVLRLAPATGLSTLHPGQGPRALEAYAGPFGDDGYVVYWRDVTEQFLAAQALSHSEGRFRRLLEHAEEGIIVIDEAGKTTMMNDACARMLGVDAAAVVGRSAFDTLTATMTDEQRSFIAQRMQDRKQSGARYEWPYLRPDDGRLVQLWISSTPVFRDDGTFEASITFVTDVTAQREAERRYRLLAENSTDVIRICDPDDVVTYISPSSESVLGYRPDQIIGRHWHEFLEPDDAAVYLIMLSEIGERPESFIRQARFRRSDGVVIWLESAVRQVRDPMTGELVELQASSRDVTERLRTLRALEDSEERYRHRAVHDPLTALPNRDLLFDRLAHALDASRRTGSQVAVLFVDIDNFKFINDSLGHDVGDRLLVEVGNRIAAVARAGDTVARFGGDEYVVVCERVAGESAAVAVAERVAARLRESVEVNEHRLRLTVSIGIAVGGAGRETPDELLRSADLAMYRAKQRGRNRWEIFDTSLSTDAARRLHIESELRDALDNGQLRVHYQPIADLRSGALTGVEALVRWEHPTRGLLLPVEFLDIAEETGLIVAIGAQVLHRACADGARWLAGHPDRPMTVAVNVSLRQLGWGDFTAVIDQALAESGLDPRLLHLELTETALFDATRTSPTDLSAIDRLGVAIGIDDFGTGYSSLAYLKRFPVRFLKIDKTFIDGLGVEAEDTAIVQAIINLGHTLGLDVIAEGLETVAQLEQLQSLGCTAAQGYLLARPQPFDDLTPVLLGGAGRRTADENGGGESSWF